MGFFDSFTPSRALGDIFTGGLAETNLFGGLPKKAGKAVGNALTLNPGGSNTSGSVSPSGTAPVGSGSLFDTSGDMSKLQALFAPIAANANTAIDDSTAQQLKQLRSNQAARGVLRSGISDIPTGDIMKGASLAKGQVQSGLANIFGNTEASRSLFGTQANFDKAMADLGYGHTLDLTNQIAALNKPSQLQQIFGAVQQLGPTALALAGMF